jgi:hypothetical protein
LTGVSGNVKEGTIVPNAWLSPLFCVIRFKSGKATHRLLIWSNDQSADEYRRLLVWMRLSRFAENAY